MNKIIIAITFFFICLFFYSKLGPNLPISILTQQKGEPLMVTEQGKVSAAPDMAVISVGIEENGTNLSTVENSVNQKAKTVADVVKKSGVKSEDIQTLNYSVYPNYDYSVTPNKISSYRVSTTYQIQIRDLNKVNDIMAVLTPAGANQIGGITFTFSDETKAKLMDTARREAVNKAKEKAQSLAKAAGISLGKIINISEASIANSPRPLFTASEIGKDAMATPNIEPGQSEIFTSVTISWEIK